MINSLSSSYICTKCSRCSPSVGNHIPIFWFTLEYQKSLSGNLKSNLRMSPFISSSTWWQWAHNSISHSSHQPSRRFQQAQLLEWKECIWHICRIIDYSHLYVVSGAVRKLGGWSRWCGGGGRIRYYRKPREMTRPLTIPLQPLKAFNTCQLHIYQFYWEIEFKQKKTFEI